MAIVSINRKVGRPSKKVFKEVDNEINFSDWIASNSTSAHGEVINKDEVGVGFIGKRGTGNLKAKTVIIKIGKDIIDRLGWEEGDSVSPYNHQDDMMQFMLIKRAAGYKIQKHPKSPLLYIRYPWRINFPLQVTKTHAVEFYIHKSGYLVFKAQMNSPQQEIIDA